MGSDFVSYAVGARYDGPEINGPFGSGVGLIFEGVPIYKIWLEDPSPDELKIFDGMCTHIGFSTSRPNISSMPFFLFRYGDGKEFKVQAPMCSLPQQVKRWAAGDSNIIAFLLIDLDSRIVETIGVVGIPSDFRKKLVDIWSTGHHLSSLDGVNQKDMQTVASESPNLHPSTTWVFDPVTNEFELMSGELFASSILEAAHVEASNLEILVGELIEFQMYDPLLGVKRHDVGKVIKIDGSQNITAVLRDGGRHVRFRLKDYPYVGYAYAPSGAPAKLQSPETLIMDEDNNTELRVILTQEVLEPYGYAWINRLARGSSPSRS